MPDTVDLLAKYLHLARVSGMRRRPQVRDRLLIMSAVTAAKAGLPRIAAYCRRHVLEHNPRHIIRRWTTMADALRDAEFQHFLAHLEKRYSPEASDQLLKKLSLDLAHERETYFSDEEYAAALLGTTPEKLAEMFLE